VGSIARSKSLVRMSAAATPKKPASELIGAAKVRMYSSVPA
jgi:hypothetical protein